MRQSPIKEHFEKTAGEYHRDFAKRGSRGDELANRYLSHLLPGAKNKRVLEIGCGPGTFLQPITEVAASVTGVDLSETMLQIARRENSDFHLALAEGSRLPFADGSFDMAYAIRTFQHVPEPEPFLGEIRRVLSGDGLFMIDFMNSLNPIAWVRDMLSSTSDFVYLKSISAQRMKRLCDNAGLEVTHLLPVALFVDASNLQKYLPLISMIPDVVKSMEYVPRENSLAATFALRLLVCGQAR